MLRKIPALVVLLALIGTSLAQDSTAAGRAPTRTDNIQAVHSNLPLSLGYHVLRAANVPSESVLYSFESGKDGTHPFSALISDGSGALYGTTSGGGAIGGGNGTVYKLTPSRKAFSIDFRAPMVPLHMADCWQTAAVRCTAQRPEVALLATEPCSN
jgi:uncharacterized repeat protein (TIGR03803 family)